MSQGYGALLVFQDVKRAYLLGMFSGDHIDKTHPNFRETAAVDRQRGEGEAYLQQGINTLLHAVRKAEMALREGTVRRNPS